MEKQPTKKKRPVPGGAPLAAELRAQLSGLVEKRGLAHAAEALGLRPWTLMRACSGGEVNVTALTALTLGLEKLRGAK